VSENTQLVASPGARSAANGAFSPDGNFLALEVSFANNGDGAALALRLDVASMASGRLTVVPGTWVSSDALIGFGWPAVSDTLVAELSFTSRVQLASWRPGAARLAVAADRPGLTAGSGVRQGSRQVRGIDEFERHRAVPSAPEPSASRPRSAVASSLPGLIEYRG
jgi:hypothetical protein